MEDIDWHAYDDKSDKTEEKSKKLFAEAEQRQNRFVIGGGKDKAERAKIAHLTSSATKLQQLAQQQFPQQFSRYQTFQEQGYPR